MWSTLHPDVRVSLDDAELAGGHAGVVVALSNVVQLQHVLADRRRAQVWRDVLKDDHSLLNHGYLKQAKLLLFCWPSQVLNVLVSSALLTCPLLCHLTCGIGLPTATHVRFTDAPTITSYSDSGGMVNCGGTRRTGKSTGCQ